MSLIDRAWKANVNVWKRHLTLQSVFNCGECMMHVDKNANGHVLDQNVDRILKEIAYVPLSGRIKFKRSSCMQHFFLFFFFLKKIKNRYKTCLPMVWWIWIFWTCFPEVRWIEVWMCFPEVRWFGILDVLPRGPRIEVWTCFSEVRWIEVWMFFPKVQWIGILDVLPRGPMD